MNNIWITIFAFIGGVITTLIALLVITEIVLRLSTWFRKNFLVKEVNRKDFLSTGYKPYIDWIENYSKPMFEYLPVGFRFFNNDNPIISVKNNALGFRGEEFSTPNPDELRICVVGGSAAWGCGASSNETTITGWLEPLINADKRLLGEKFSKAKCFNLAQVNGYQTQDLLTLLFFAEKIRPDYVISFTGWNELVASSDMNVDYLKKFGVYYLSELEGWKPAAVSNKNELLKNAFLRWGKERFELFRTFPFKQKKSSSKSSTLEERIQIGTELFCSHVGLMQRLAKAFEFQHLQFTQPYIYRKNFLTAQEAKVIELYDFVRPVMGGKPFGDYLRHNNIYLPIIKTFRQNPDLGPIKDLCDMFTEEKDTMFYTLVHLTDEGYRRVARELYETLLSLSYSSRKERELSNAKAV